MDTEKKIYATPELAEHGKLVEVTQDGGALQNYDADTNSTGTKN